MASFRIHPLTWEITYEITLARSGFSLLDAPGKLCDAFIEKLAPFGVVGEDFEFPAGNGADRALTCELTGFDGTITFHGDRLEIYFSNRDHEDEDLKSVLAAIWQSFEMISQGFQAKDHSVLLEIEAEIVDHPYQEFLNAFAPIPHGLPQETRSAVVYYLPADPKLDGKESSVVFNGTDNVVPDLSLSATLVYSKIEPANAVHAAWDRLTGILGAMGVSLASSVQETQT